MRWRRWLLWAERLRRRFLGRVLLIALLFPLAALVSLGLADTPIVRDTRLGIDDKLLFLWGPEVLSRSETITIVEIDNATLGREWRWNGAALSRARLAELVAEILRHRPKHLLVDLDLSFDAPDPGGDEALRGVLSDPAKVGKTRLLLIRALRMNPTGGEPPALYRAGTLDLDALAATAPTSRQIHWIDTTVGREEDDWTARSIPAWNVGCNERGEHVVALSPGYLLRLLGKADGPLLARKLTGRLSQAMEGCSPPAGGWPDLADEEPFRRLDADTRAWLRAGTRSPLQASRIAFGFRDVWDDVGGEPAAPLRPVEIDGLARVSASALRPNRAADPALHDAIAGRTAIVARTDWDSEDRIRTPAGVLPGGAVLANAVSTVVALARPLEPNGVITAASLLVALLLLLLDARFDPRGHHLLLATLAFFLVSVLAWVVALRLGYWLDMSVAVFAATLTKAATDLMGGLVARAKREGSG